MLLLAMPAYVMAYAYTDWLQFTGPVQTALRDRPAGARANTGFRRSARFPARRRCCRSRSTPTSISSRAPRSTKCRAAPSRRRGSPVTAPWGAFWRVAVPLARPAIGSGRHARADGDARRLRHGVVLRRRGLHHRHLQGVVLDGRRGRRGAALELPARLRAGRAGAGAREPRARRVSQRRAAQARAAAPPEGPGALLALRLRRAGGVRLRPSRVLLAALHGAKRRLTWARASWRLPATASGGGPHGSHRGRSRHADGVRGPAHAESRSRARESRRQPGLRHPRRGDRGRRAGAPRQARQCARGLDRVVLRHEHGLLFTGTVAALVYAYLVRLLAVALQTTDAGLAKITPSMEHAARSLGASAAGRSRACMCRFSAASPRPRCWSSSTS